MRIRRLAVGVLRIAGILLIALGVIHLAATPHLPHLTGWDALLGELPAGTRTDTPQPCAGGFPLGSFGIFHLARVVRLPSERRVGAADLESKRGGDIGSADIRRRIYATTPVL